MSKFLIRFNKSRGQKGRGSMNHAWRVFEDGKEYLVKHIKISVPVWDETDGQDWNIACEGTLQLDRDTSTAIIKATIKVPELENA
jgi:hypothetical protein